MEQRLTKLWYSDAAGISWLQPLAWLYGGVMRLRRWAYRVGWRSTHTVGKPVVVVGNLTVLAVDSPVVLRQIAVDDHEVVGIAAEGQGAHPDVVAVFGLAR